MCGVDTKETYLEILYFKQFYKHFVFTEDGDGNRNKRIEKYFGEISDLRARNILSAWKTQLNRDDDRNVALVSPMECSFLVDLTDRAHNTSGKAEDFYAIQIMKSSKEFQVFYKDFCMEMGLNYEKDTDIIKSIDYLRRITYKPMSEYTIRELINQNIQFLFISEKDIVYNVLVSLVVTEDILGKEITQSMFYEFMGRNVKRNNCFGWKT